MAKILVIDDEPSVRMSLEIALRRTGHKILLAADGAEGLECFTREKPVLVITDLFMPGTDGIQVIMALRKTEPRVPVIAITGNPVSSLPAMATKLGATEVLEKPFSQEQLLTAVHRALPSSSN